MLRLSSFLCLMFSTSISAQSLSPDDIARMLNSEKPVENPYADLLNDPDPKRGVGAMRIMMESGDKNLVDLALEYGLLSANPDVQIAALDAYIRTQPRMLVTIDARSGVTGGLARFSNYHDGIFTDDEKIFFRWKLGSYNADEECVLNSNYNHCAFLINKYGIFVDAKVGSGTTMVGQVTISANGDLVGNISFDGDEFRARLSFSIKL